MFDSVQVVLSSLITWWSMIINNLLNGMSYIGVSVIGLIVLRKFVNIFRKVK